MIHNSSRHTRLVLTHLGSAWLCVALLGCSGQGTDYESFDNDSTIVGSNEGIELGEIGAALAFEGPFTWSNSQANVALKPVDSHYCVLTAVRGNFRGSGEHVKVFTHSGVWQLGGRGVQAISAEAMCFRRDAFIGEGTNENFFLAPANSDFDASPNAVAYNTSHGFLTVPAELWHGDSASMISGIGGTFNGDLESIEVTQASRPEDLSFLEAGTRVTGGSHTKGYGASFYVGIPNRLYHTARFVGPGGEGNADEAGEYEASPGQSKLMGDVDQTMCYFTTISGTLKGLNHGASIGTKFQSSTGRTRWILRSDLAMARARCFKFDQTS